MPTTTEVSFPSGCVTGQSTVVRTDELGEGRVGVVTAATPFHPVDHTWPDQPGDQGLLGGRKVVDSVVGAGKGEDFFVGKDIPVRRGDPEWQWFVVHVLEKADDVPVVGERVELEVDRARRRALSAGHTGCHLMAFALNEALADHWRKEVLTDSLGSPNFDQLAMDSSRITAGGSIDEYRIGKSLRKKGFTPDDYKDLQAAVNTRLAEWLATGAPVEVQTDGPLLTDARRWLCVLPDGEASVACGGTHLGSLKQLRSLTVAIDATDTSLRVTTTAES